MERKDQLPDERLNHIAPGTTIRSLHLMKHVLYPIWSTPNLAAVLAAYLDIIRTMNMTKPILFVGSGEQSALICGSLKAQIPDSGVLMITPRAKISAISGHTSWFGQIDFVPILSYLNGWINKTRTNTN